MRNPIRTLFDDLRDDRLTMVDAFFWYVVGGLTMFLLDRVR